MTFEKWNSVVNAQKMALEIIANILTSNLSDPIESIDENYEEEEGSMMEETGQPGTEGSSLDPELLQFFKQASLLHSTSGKCLELAQCFKNPFLFTSCHGAAEALDTLLLRSLACLSNIILCFDDESLISFLIYLLSIPLNLFMIYLF